MGRFSCFYSSLQNHKHKRSAQPSFETMVKVLQLGAQNHPPSDSMSPAALHENSEGNDDINYIGNDTHGWRSGEFKCEYGAWRDMESVHFEMGNLRRSLSVGCSLDQERRVIDENKTYDCIELVNSCEGSQNGVETELSKPRVAKSQGTTLPDPDGEALQSLSPRCSSDLVNHESIFCISDPNFLEKEGVEDCRASLNPECADGSDEQASNPCAPRISKSNSMPNIGSTSTFTELSPRGIVPHNRSFEDLRGIVMKKQDFIASDTFALGISGYKDDSFCHSEKFDVENAGLDNYDSLDHFCPSKDWIVPVPDEDDITKHVQGNVSHSSCFPSENFKIKRIEDWVNGLQHCSPVEETNFLSSSQNEAKRASTLLDGFDKEEIKMDASTEIAKRYISSLNATTTTMQLANHGLTAIPLLSAFVGLKALNLSGNSIVRITAGALPRGLHMLNLAKNKLSAIEGLRELTRLRVLDVSYNKISRIGHGLASCSSVKELYLAGNKISEVEGLHRLLKLAVLDLRFNKIATSKSLGQLAANYNSLQAISLEGNPAQKNVGDEQLKKSLLGLLPHLAYYNRQHIKTSTLKDSSDRSVRLGISGHQFDRGVRSDQKSSSRRSVTKRSTHSSSHGHKGLASELLKQSRGKHGLVPSGSRMSHHHHNQLDEGDNLLRLKASLSLTKSRSEGTLTGL